MELCASWPSSCGRRAPGPPPTTPQPLRALRHNHLRHNRLRHARCCTTTPSWYRPTWTPWPPPLRPRHSTQHLAAHQAATAPPRTAAAGAARVAGAAGPACWRGRSWRLGARWTTCCGTWRTPRAVCTAQRTPTGGTAVCACGRLPACGHQHARPLAWCNLISRAWLRSRLRAFTLPLPPTARRAGLSAPTPARCAPRAAWTPRPAARGRVPSTFGPTPRWCPCSRPQAWTQPSSARCMTCGPAVSARAAARPHALQGHGPGTLGRPVAGGLHGARRQPQGACKEMCARVGRCRGTCGPSRAARRLAPAAALHMHAIAPIPNTGNCDRSPMSDPHNEFSGMNVLIQVGAWRGAPNREHVCGS